MGIYFFNMLIKHTYKQSNMYQNYKHNNASLMLIVPPRYTVIYKQLKTLHNITFRCLIYSYENASHVDINETEQDRRLHQINNRSPIQVLAVNCVA